MACPFNQAQMILTPPLLDGIMSKFDANLIRAQRVSSRVETEFSIEF